MKRIILPVILSVAVACGLTSCRESVTSLPDGVMDEEQMVDFLSEAYLLEGFYAIETGNHPSLVSDEVSAAYQELLDAHGLTEEQFEKSMTYYSEHLDQYDKIHQQVIERLDEVK